jgi:hypothetical protein
MVPHPYITNRSDEKRQDMKTENGFVVMVDRLPLEKSTNPPSTTNSPNSGDILEVSPL